MWRNGNLLKSFWLADRQARVRMLRAIWRRAPGAHRVQWSWVPIRSLAASQRPHIEAHLLGLSREDRYLRFGYVASDEQIQRYASALDFDGDQLFGIVNDDLTLVAMAHLAYEPAPQFQDRPPMVEFGVSVAHTARGKGYGSRMFAHAVLHARNRGTSQLFIHALSENTAMLRIAAKAGASVRREGSESEAWLDLPPDTLLSQLGGLLEEHAAEMHFQWTTQRQGLDGLRRLAQKVRDSLRKSPPRSPPDAD